MNQEITREEPIIREGNYTYKIEDNRYSTDKRRKVTITCDSVVCISKYIEKYENPKLTKEEKLSLWCYEQDKAYALGNLSKEKVKRLKEIDFPFGFYYKKKVKK